MSMSVSLTVLCEPHEVPKATEVLGRAATGLALEGISVSISVVTFEEEGK